ncbi:MAG: hypothetical protein IPI45_06280 [Saprospiraceae bacterium]|nr:hypothetical protein [Saprospiraceae bacterium]MBK7737367.1 hypothetical protein [Saprospiraceae bacterium]MBK7914053.1 hypothetical protein [Saprospiraceae bacterium]
MKTTKTILCPSSRAQTGARLLGIRQEDGSMAILPEPLKIDNSFIDISHQLAPAEQQFRFTNKCVESGCKQWTGARCGVADKLIQACSSIQLANTLPECGIRPQCRWYKQNGDEACKICPLVITELTEEEWVYNKPNH